MKALPWQDTRLGLHRLRCAAELARHRGSRTRSRCFLSAREGFDFCGIHLRQQDQGRKVARYPER